MNANTPIDTPLPVLLAVIKAREPKRARQLAWLSTGLGHIYAGALVRGLWFNAGMVLPGVFAALMLVGSWGHPAYALIPVAISLAVYVWSVWDAAKIVRATRADYRLKDYNSSSAYLLLGTVPSLAVAVAIAVSISGFIGQAFRVQSDLPSLGIHRGDLVTLSKLAYREQAPKSGDMVIFQSKAQHGENWIGRVQAVAGETVTTREGKTVLVPQDYVWMHRDDLPDGGSLVSSYAIRGRIVYRLLPLSRSGDLPAAGVAAL